MAKFFTADTHFSDSRLELYFRPFRSVSDMDETLIANWNRIVKKEDDVYHLGDFSTTPEGFKLTKKLNGKIHLILGNYDKEVDPNLFESIQKDLTLAIKGTEYYLIHKPIDTIPDRFNLCGHIHGLWKVQENIINVGTDAWHFLPISEDQIEFTRNAIVNYYDENVFFNNKKTARLDFSWT